MERVEVKDVRVPENLQRAMAAEAEAAREARAKVSWLGTVGRLGWPFYLRAKLRKSRNDKLAADALHFTLYLSTLLSVILPKLLQLRSFGGHCEL